MRSTLVLQSIDSPRRDFEWRLYMAKRLLDEGMSSVIGGAGQLRRLARSLRGCIYLGRLGSHTGRSQGDQRLLRAFDDNGHKLFYLHDEGAFWHAGYYKQTARQTHPVEFLDAPCIERMYLWGEAQREVLLEDVAPELRSKLVVSGAPRFDLSRPQFASLDDAAVADHKRRYGDFVLIVGRYPIANKGPSDPSPLGKRRLQIMLESGWGRSFTEAELTDHLFRRWSRVTHEWVDFVVAMSRLVAKFPQQRFLLRPHPSESLAFYEDAFERFENVQVSKEGDIRSVLRAAKMVLHTGSTSGLEAEISERPHLNFQPLMGVDMDFSVGGLEELGEVVTDTDALEGAFVKMIANPTFTPSAVDISHYLRNMPGHEMATDFLVRELAAYVDDTGLRTEQLRVGVKDRLRWRRDDARRRMLHVRGSLSPRRFSRESVHGQGGKKVAYGPDAVHKLWGCFGGDSAALQNRYGMVLVGPTARQLKGM